MAPADNQLSFEGKVSFILGGIALMVAASSILEYMLKRSEGIDDYDQYADIEELDYSSPEWCNLSTNISLDSKLQYREYLPRNFIPCWSSLQFRNTELVIGCNG